MALNCSDDNSGYGDGLYGFGGYGGSLDFNNDAALHDAFRNTPIRVERGTNFEKLLCSLQSQLDRVSSETQDVAQARDVRHATGRQLERIGSLVGVSRTENETDDHLRERIQLAGHAAVSEGTTDEIIELARFAFRTTYDDISFPIDLATDPATFVVRAESGDATDIALTASEVAEELEKSLPAGHRVTVDATCSDVIPAGTTQYRESTYTVDDTCVDGTLIII